MNELKIGICGWGNVATGLYKSIHKNKKQPKNLLQLKNYNEDWDENEILAFYEENNMKMV